MRHWAEIPFQKWNAVGSTQHDEQKNRFTNLASHFLVGAKCAIALFV